MDQISPHLETGAAIRFWRSGNQYSGQVIGIAPQVKFQITGQLVEGMGFAIPANDVVQYYQAAREEKGKVVRPALR